MVQGIRAGMLQQTFYVLCLSSLAGFCSGSDIILTGQALLTNQTMVSKQGNFELGFFFPGNSSDCYVGIWYKNIRTRTVVWVANRENPIASLFYDNSFLALQNGSLYIYNNMDEVIWATISGSTTSNHAAAILLDTGNLILTNGIGVVWQSFDHPGDTWLPGAKIGLNWITNTPLGLNSWRNTENPAKGLYTLNVDPTGNAELFLWRNNSNIVWRSGAWQSGNFPFMATNGHDFFNFSYTANDDGKYIVYNANNSIVSRIVMTMSGVMQQYVWSPSAQRWTVFRNFPSSQCEVYASCGAFGFCDINISPFCHCLPGFKPKLEQDWDLGDFSGGCVRKKSLDCGRDKQSFQRVPEMRLPAYSESLAVGRAEICEFACSSNCSCSAYTYSSRGGCSMWFGDLIDLQKQQNGSTGGDLYVKFDSSEFPAKGLKMSSRVAIATSSAVVSIFLICSVFYYLRRRKHKQKGAGEKYQNLLLLDLNGTKLKDNGGATTKDSHAEEKNANIGLPIFSFSSIAAATCNFSVANKLGEGGFGPVYKGELLNGELVAVKRLSKRSRQGLEEFKNETELIAELQHRNLVRILGCCVEEDEKILIYEYMPNKSLDFFLFDPKQEVLDWQQRLHIIQGIAQGLLYLHQYSRLRIVHRDLKASNILLDRNMDPKISDFGLARIFGVNELQANTNHIVGTYGYMSPEYVMEGLFSIKSDVFAFGILVLEILSGKKNTGYYGSDHLALLGYAWELWKSNRALELIDPLLQIPSSSQSVRYIILGLLCVQENPNDRPTMSDVVSMLSNEQISVASPKQPAFTTWRNVFNPSSNGGELAVCSTNDVTISAMEAR